MIKRGFTLAEVLITLGIIGIVAAMTLPGLINNFQKKALITSLKKNYNTAVNACRLMIAKDGVDTIEETAFYKAVKSQDYTKFKEESMRYFNNAVVKKGGLSSNSIKYVSAETDSHGNPEYTSSYMYRNGSAIRQLRDIYTIVLPSGAISFSDMGDNENLILYIDANGPDKRPNKVGDDLFSFEFEINSNCKIRVENNDGYCTINTETMAHAHVATSSCMGSLIKNNWEVKYDK